MLAHCNKIQEENILKINRPSTSINKKNDTISRSGYIPGSLKRRNYVAVVMTVFSFMDCPVSLHLRVTLEEMVVKKKKKKKTP